MHFRTPFFYLFVILLFSSCSLFKQTRDSFSPQMVQIKGGTFMLGDFYEGANPDAIPVHQVTVDDFKLGKYEITYAQFDHYSTITGTDSLRSNSSDRGNRAAAFVTWDQALAFCNHYGYRLPSEIEWEYAARSGGKNYLYSGTNSRDSLAFYALTNLMDLRQTFRVGITRPNQLGLYDMSGNAFEWIGDFYQFYSSPDKFHTQETDAIRLIRGGSYYESLEANRTYWRSGTLRDISAQDVGFRCAAD